MCGTYGCPQRLKRSKRGSPTRSKRLGRCNKRCWLDLVNMQSVRLCTGQSFSVLACQDVLACQGVALARRYRCYRYILQKLIRGCWWHVNWLVCLVVVIWVVSHNHFVPNSTAVVWVLCCMVAHPLTSHIMRINLLSVLTDQQFSTAANCAGPDTVSGSSCMCIVHPPGCFCWLCLLLFGLHAVVR